jgi:hypothetical protein
MSDTADIAEAAVKPTLSAKGVRALLDRLPDSDVAYHLDVVIKVPEAEASDVRNDISHEEMKR